MQVPLEPSVAALLKRIIADELPNGRGVGAWRALLQAHATLTRQLATDLEKQTGLALGDFDVLAQLAQAGGELRMTELAARAFTSRSGLTRRVSRPGQGHPRLHVWLRAGASTPGVVRAMQPGGAIGAVKIASASLQRPCRQAHSVSPYRQRRRGGMSIIPMRARPGTHLAAIVRQRSPRSQ